MGISKFNYFANYVQKLVKTSLHWAQVDNMMELFFIVVLKDLLFKEVIQPILEKVD